MAGTRSDPTAKQPVRVLIADHDDVYRGLVASELLSAGFVVEQFHRADDADVRLGAGSIDLVIMNWALPRMSGAAFCQRTRQRSSLPIIVLADSGTEDDKIRALDAGADDYLVKPLSMRELMARVHAVLRRARDYRSDAVEETGGITIDRGSRRVLRGGRDIHLGPLEWGLLSFLIARPGQVYSRAQLLDAIWPEDTTAGERTVDVNIGRLRRALRIEGEPDPIATVRGIGYTFLHKLERLPYRNR